MKFKSLLATAILGATAYAGAAQAAIESSTAGGNNAGGNELMFAFYNPDSENNTTYILDTGIAFNDINNTSQYSFAADGTLSGLLGNAGWQWSVLAADTVSGGTGANPDNYGKRLLATSGLGGATVADLGALDTASSQVGDLGTQANFVANHAGTLVTDNNTSVSNGGNGTYLNAMPDGTNAGSVGDTLEFYLYGADGSISTNPFGATTFNPSALTTELLGTWTLASNGTLSFTGSAVPVPAAVWLFGSALLGLVGVSRRKQS